MAREGAKNAAKIAREALNNKSNLQTLDLLLQARQMLDDTDQQETSLMQQTIRNAVGDRIVYSCTQCGFRARHYHWQCPACNAWESLPSEPREPVL